MDVLEGYKVVSVRGRGIQGVYRSWVDMWCYKSSMVTYKVGEWAKPKRGCGSLFVFTTLKSARECPLPCIGDKIFKCLYVKSKDGLVYMRDEKPEHFEDIPTAFEDVDVADKVKLLEEVV